MKLLTPPEQLREIRQFEFFDDFLWHISTQWTNLASDTNSSVAIDADGVGGIVAINTGDATDNNEAALASTNELFKFASDKPMMAEAKIQYAEHNTNAANVAFGWADAIGANLVTDNGAAITANSAALIFKKDGETTWRAYCENNGTTVETASTTTAGGASYQTLRIVVFPVDGTNVEVTYFVDGEPLRDSNGKAIKHTLAYASATEMDFGVYAKAGGASTHTVNVDYVYVAQLR